VSIAEIAKKANVAQASIYNYFQDKENLKKELIQKIMNDCYLETMNILESSDPIKHKLEKFLLTRAEYLAQYPEDFLPDFTKNEFFLKEYVNEENYVKLKNAFIGLLEDGKREGVINKSFSTEAMLGYLEVFHFYIMNNSSIVSRLREGSKTAHEVMALFLNAFLSK
jgi:AcrR family transcriptional regulator